MATYHEKLLNCLAGANAVHAPPPARNLCDCMVQSTCSANTATTNDAVCAFNDVDYALHSYVSSHKARFTTRPVDYGYARYMCNTMKRNWAADAGQI